MFEPGDIAMIVRTCGCPHYEFSLGKTFTVARLEKFAMFCSYDGPFGSNPHYRTMLVPQLVLIAEKADHRRGFQHAPAAWCIRLPPSQESLSLEEVKELCLIT